MAYEQIKFVDIDMPVAQVPDMPTARLVFGRYKVVWGKYCYIDRKSYPEVSGYDKDFSYVNVSSLGVDRVREMEEIFSRINYEFAEEMMSAATASSKFAVMGRYYVWVDKNKISSNLCDKDARQRVAKLYIENLKFRYMSSSRASNYFAKEQSRFIGVLSLVFDDASLWMLQDRLSVLSSAYNSTEPPDEDDVGLGVALCEAIFSQYSDVCLKFKAIPFQLDIEEKVWVFASGGKSSSKTMCHLTGALKSRDEIFESYGRDEATAAVMYNNEVRRYKRVNSESRCKERIRLAGYAARAFFYLFLVNTGINVGDAVNLTVEGEFDFYSPRQRYRAFKARAGGREIVVEFGVKFLPLFKLYLMLRRYLLGEQEFPFLFAIFDKRNRRIQQEYPAAISTYEKYLKTFKPDLRLPRPMELRAFKSNYLVSNFDPAVTATILQNSEKVVEQSYSRGSETNAAIEISNFFNDILCTDEGRAKLINIVDVAAGSCSCYGDPVSIDPLVEPKCEGCEGCVFCSRFTLHSDERDLRKLISFKYYIVVLMGRAMDEASKVLAEKYLARIAQILRYISGLSESYFMLIERVERSVFLGEVSDYWQSKLDMLLSIGLIADEDFN